MNRRQKETLLLKECIDHILDFRGRTPMKLNMKWGGGNIPALSANNVRDGYIDFEKECYLGSEEIYKKWMTKGESKRGDIVFTMEAPIGNVAQIPDNKKYILSQRVVLLSPKEEIINENYLYHFMRSDIFRKQCKNFATGTTAKGIKQSNLLLTKVKVPPLPEQKKIAEILSGIDKTLEKSNNLIYKLKMFKNSLRINIFREEKSSEKWQTYSLKEISDVIDSLHITPSFSKKGFAMVRVTDIKTGDLSLSKTKKVSLEVFEKFVKKYHPKTGDIVMSRVGSYGVSSYVTTSEKFCMGQNTVVINPRNISSRYLYECLNSNFIQNQIQLEVAGSGYKSLSLADIRDLKIPVAPIDEQNKFAAELKSIDNVILIQEKKITAINALKNSLMQDLLSGRKRVII